VDENKDIKKVINFAEKTKNNFENIVVL